MLGTIVSGKTAVGLLNAAFSFQCYVIPTPGLSQPCREQSYTLAEFEAGNHYWLLHTYIFQKIVP